MVDKLKDSYLDPLDKSDFVLANKGISSDTHKNDLREASIVVMFSAAAVGSSVALLPVPNLETLTIIFFVTSLYFGLKIGFSIMLTSTIVFELFASVYGFGGILIFFKFISYSLVVLVGSSLKSLSNRDFSKEKSYRIFFGLMFSILGLIFTMVFDVITSFDRLITLQDLDAYLLFFYAGVPFYIFHQITNVILFFFTPEYIQIMKLTEHVYN